VLIEQRQEALFPGGKQTFPEGCRAVAFAANDQGLCDAGAAGHILRTFDLSQLRGDHDLGTAEVIAVRDEHGVAALLAVLYIHTLGQDGWADSPKHLASALNEVATYFTAESDKALFMPTPGTGMIGQMQGAPVDELLKAMDESDLRITAVTL
jgi:hypothetical protein